MKWVVVAESHAEQAPDKSYNFHIIRRTSFKTQETKAAGDVHSFKPFNSFISPTVSERTSVETGPVLTPPKARICRGFFLEQHSPLSMQPIV